MKIKVLWAICLLLVLGATVAAYGVTVGTPRSDCHDKVTCRITGEEVCRYKCPTVNAKRVDCPGKLECPLTGELVCRDECPLSKSAAETRDDSDLRPCCRAKQSK